MYPEAYKDWIEIFDDDFSEIWQKERKELQKSAMLLSALHKELQRVKTDVEIEVSNIRQQLKHRDCLKEKKLLSASPKNGGNKAQNSGNKENEYDLGLYKAAATSSINKPNFDDTESPDLFRNVISNSPTMENSVIDLSISDEDNAKANRSPTIKKRRRYFKKSKSPESPTFAFNLNSELKKTDDNSRTNVVRREELVKKNILRTPVGAKTDNDLSIIECTPEVRPKRTKATSRIGEFLSKKSKTKRSNNTLTQMFSGKTKLDSLRKTRTEENTDSDKTYFEVNKERSEMGITDMLEYINKNEETTSADKTTDASTTDEPEGRDMDVDMDSSQESDEFSKGLLLEDIDVDSPVVEKPKAAYPEVEPVVRGKARKQLKGWACEQCKNFYGQMNLPPDELQKRMDECSRHRYKYRPPEETLPGFWELTIPSQKQD